MAISYTHYQLLMLLKSRGELPQGGRILEIGKANIYGDMECSDFESVLAEVSDEERRRSLQKRLEMHMPNSLLSLRYPDPYEPVSVIYELMFQPADVQSFDGDPAAVARGAIPVDLNFSIDRAPEMSVVFNHGTAEHVFNIANVFKVMHDACEVGGLMIHESPFTGWTSHGFWNLQPPVFYDLARENGYEMVLVATEHLRSRTYIEWPSHEAILRAKLCDQLPDHAMLFVAMRKKSEELFKFPTQGIYSGNASPFTQQMWGALR